MITSLCRLETDPSRIMRHTCSMLPTGVADADRGVGLTGVPLELKFLDPCASASSTLYCVHFNYRPGMFCHALGFH